MIGDVSISIHPSAEVEDGAYVGAGTRVWQLAHIRASAYIGSACNIGMGVYIDTQVKIGSFVKVQNYAQLFDGVQIADGVFIGPQVCFTNDLYPRAITIDGQLKSAADWHSMPTFVRYGASIGAGAVIVCGVTIGEFALVGAGSVVTNDVAAHALVTGNPARFQGYVCRCAHPLDDWHEDNGQIRGFCPSCQQLCGFAVNVNK
ncbi:MAG TPA: acyltransferase [Dictyobacter sp.]|nr:acyltransferase [Dictyobacter sp.]